MWDTYDALKSKTKEKNKRGKKTSEACFWSLGDRKALWFSDCELRSACLHAYSEEKGRTHTRAIWKEKIEYHPELEEHDSNELVIFSALQKSLI